jgi:hypothetical protein
VTPTLEQPAWSIQAIEEQCINHIVQGNYSMVLQLTEHVGTAVAHRSLTTTVLCMRAIAFTMVGLLPEARLLLDSLNETAETPSECIRIANASAILHCEQGDVTKALFELDQAASVQNAGVSDTLLTVCNAMIVHNTINKTAEVPEELLVVLHQQQLFHLHREIASMYTAKQ